MGKEKSKMGRPPKPPAQKWGKRITINMTSLEWKLLKEEAKRLGVESLSELVMQPWRKLFKKRK